MQKSVEIYHKRREIAKILDTPGPMHYNIPSMFSKNSPLRLRSGFRYAPSTSKTQEEGFPKKSAWVSNHQFSNNMGSPMSDISPRKSPPPQIRKYSPLKVNYFPRSSSYKDTRADML